MFEQDPVTIAALVLVARITLGAIFLSSSLGKLRAPAAFVRGVEAYNLVPAPPARAIGWLLPWLELALAVMLFAKLALPVAGIVAALVLLVFIFAVAVNLRRGRIIACNCHGIADTRPISRGTIARNSILFTLTLPLIMFSPVFGSSEAWLASWRADLALFAMPAEAMLVVMVGLCCWAIVQLAEWVFDIETRVAGVKRAYEGSKR